jgi:hypothetical protein
MAQAQAGHGFLIAHILLSQLRFQEPNA